MHMDSARVEDAFSRRCETEAPVMRGFAIAAAISLLIWLIPLAAWFLLAN